MAFIDESGKWIGRGPDPRQIGGTTVAPAKFDVNAIPQISIPQGKTIDEWANLLNANSGYMGFKLSAAKTADEAAAMRKAAIRSLAIQYGGLPAGFQDVYGDLSEEDISNASANPLSQTAQLARSYAQSQDDFRRGLAARGALQSGDLGYGLDRLDTAHSQDLYDLSNAFTSAAQGDVNQYASTLNEIEQQQMEAIRQAAQDVYSQGYRLSDGTAGAGGGGLAGATGATSDFVYGATLPAGYSDESIYNAAVANAPQGAQVMHIMNQGMVQNGMISIKYRMPDGTTNTIWIPLPAPDEAGSAPVAATAPAAQPVVAAPQTAPSVYTSPANTLSRVLSGGRSQL